LWKNLCITSDMTEATFTLSSEETFQIWKRSCEEIQVHVSSAVYSTWVLNNPVTTIELIGDTQAVCTITSPTAFHSGNLKKNLGTMMEDTLKKIVGREVELKFKIGTPRMTQANGQAAPSHLSPPSAQVNQTQSSQPTPQVPTTTTSMPSATPEVRTHQLNNRPANSIPAAPSPNTASPATLVQGISSPRVEDLFSSASLQSASLDRSKVAARQIGLRSDYTFDTFAVSTTNEMAHAAATAVSQQPGTAYNPLFLYGGVGVGKTHLMHAIANNILQTDSTTKIIYCTGEEFTNEIVSAIRTKNALKFKDKYRKAKVLMIDDIQFIAGKNTVQEEFFHTFNALTQQAHQIILTSDLPPHEINLLEDRLKSRFEAGLMIDIQQPSFELRTAILLIKANASRMTIPIELAKQIAAKVDSARKIEGLIKRLKSAVELQNKEMNSELVDELLQKESNGIKTKLKVSPTEIISAVATHYHVKQSAIRGKRRVQALVKARHVAMYLLKEELHMPLTEIGRWFSNRDHTSALHATRKIKKALNEDQYLQRDVAALKTSLAVVSR
jgi:chromosomal replication initiator protein